MADTRITIDAQIQMRHDTEANWMAADPVLRVGEPAYTIGMPDRFKIGDGQRKWSELPYLTMLEEDPEGPALPALGELADVEIEQPVEGQALVYDEVRGMWVNRAVSAPDDEPESGPVFEFIYDTTTNKATAEMVAALAEAIADNKLILCNGRTYKFILEQDGMYGLVSDAYMDIMDGKLKASVLAVMASSYDVQLMEEVVPVGTEITEATIRGWGFTKNAGTITGIKMNGETKGISGEVDLGNVLTEHQKLKTINGESIVGEGNITIQGGSATPRVEMTAESAAIEPNKFYVWPMMDSLDLTLGAEQSGVMNRYLFQFRNPKDSLTMLTLPDDITWSEDTELDENGMPVMEAAAYYRIEIIEGLASLKKWKLAYINFADAEVERVLMANGIGNGIGITKQDAKAVTSIGAMFVNNAVVESFEEFEFFTGITEITGSPWADGGFRGCANLKKIKLPKSLQAIFAGALPGQYSSTGAFKDCTSLEEITIPEGVDTIPTSIFYNCKSLEKVLFDGEPKTISDYAFANCEKLSLSIPSSVEVIGGSAFSGAPMNNVVIDCPNLAKLSGTWVFTNSKIKGVESLGKITTLTFQNNPPGAYGNYPAFYGCADMEFLNLPETLIHIGRNMFQGCSSLKGITIPSGVGELLAGTFAGCSSFEYIKILATTPPTIASDCFDSGLAIPIYVPDSSLEAYKTATGWSSWASIIYPMSSFGSAILPSFIWVNGYWGVGATSIVSNLYYAAFVPKDISDGSVTCTEANTQVRLCVFDSAGKCLARGNNVTSIADIRTACAALSASAVKWSLNFSYVGNSVDGGIAITADILANIPVDISLTE